MVVTSWGSGEPNDAGGEDYLHGFPRWNDNRSENARSGLFVEFSDFPPPAPNVADDLYAGDAGAAISRTAADGVFANDDFPAGVQAILVQSPSHGVVTLGADGSFTYTPNTGYQGRDSFRYRASTGAAAATVWLNVGINEAPPLALDDGYVVDEDATFVLGPADGISVGLVHHWKFDETNGDTAEDARGGKSATLHNWAAGESKWVSGRSGAAISISDGDDYLLTEDLAPQAEYTFSLWARRDRDGGLNPRLLASLDREWEILSYQEAGRGVGSDLVQADSPPAIGVWEHYAVTLVAATGQTQVYRDGELVASGTSRAAHPLGPWVIGHSPYLNFADDTWRGAIDDLRIYDRVLASTEIVSLVHNGTSILSNDSDLDGDALSVELVQNVAHGVLALNPDGTFSYTPTANYIGTDSFTYRVTDGSAWSNVATVALTVRNRPDPTTAIADEYSLDEDVPLNIAATQGVLANDQDLDGIPVGATVVDQPAHGTLALQPDGSFLYTPTKNYHGSDQFTYKVVDEAGVSNVAVVSLTVHPVNDAPSAVNDAYATSQVGVVQTSALRGVLANDTDPEGDALTAALVDGPAHGTLTLNADGSFLYTPAAGFIGHDKFTYRAGDGLLQSSVATVTLTVRQATVDIALRAVANPTAGDTAAALPNSLAAVNVGGEYYVEVWVQDVGAAPAGLPGGQIDLTYDTALADALGLNHGGLYNLIPTGSIDDAGGLVNDVGGGTSTPAEAGAPLRARVGFGPWAGQLSAQSRSVAVQPRRRRQRGLGQGRSLRDAARRSAGPGRTRGARGAAADRGRRRRRSRRLAGQRALGR